MVIMSTSSNEMRIKSTQESNMSLLMLKIKESLYVHCIDRAGDDDDETEWDDWT